MRDVTSKERSDTQICIPRYGPYHQLSFLSSGKYLRLLAEQGVDLLLA